MTLKFDRRKEFGHTRFYPMNQAARGVVSVVGKRTLDQRDIDTLERGGFTIELTTVEEPELNPNWRE